MLPRASCKTDHTPFDVQGRGSLGYCYRKTLPSGNFRAKLAHMEPPAKSVVDYRAVLDAAIMAATGGVIACLLEELPYLWRDAYLEMTRHPTDIVRWQRGPFEYIYDDYASLEASGDVASDPKAEARLVAALGRSEPRKTRATTIVSRDGLGPQRKCLVGDGTRDISSHTQSAARWTGWKRTSLCNVAASTAVGRWRASGFVKWRKGTFCFSRPLYADQTAKPAFLEFGALKSDGELWVERFDNR
jgi:hypothetical protein